MLSSGCAMLYDEIPILRRGPMNAVFLLHVPGYDRPLAILMSSAILSDSFLVSLAVAVAIFHTGFQHFGASVE